MVLISFLCSLLVIGAVASPQGQPGHGGPGHGQPGHGGVVWPSGGGNGAGAAPISPAYDWLFDYPLPIPPLAQPKYSKNINGQSIRYYELTIESYEHQVYPNLGPAHLTAYSEYLAWWQILVYLFLRFCSDGISPGPTFHTMRGEETVIRVLNQGSGPAAVHLHGSPSHAPWDGWSSDTVQVGQFKDYYYPNNQAGPLW